MNYSQKITLVDPVEGLVELQTSEFLSKFSEVIEFASFQRDPSKVSTKFGWNWFTFVVQI